MRSPINRAAVEEKDREGLRQRSINIGAENILKSQKSLMEGGVRHDMEAHAKPFYSH